MNDIQKQVQTAIDDLVESGAERGLQVAVYRHGEPVADAVAGVADPESERKVTSETPFYCYSIGKGATVAHVLVERGYFGYDTRVVELWPEFGAHGKETATVRHLLTNTVGVPGIPADTTPEDLCDWEKMCAAIADSEPWWEPGEKTACHAYPFGYIVGEIVRRATGKPISQVLREEVSGPHGIRAVSLRTGGVPETIPEDFARREAITESLVEPTMLGRTATLEDVGNVAAFVASDKARSMTAATANISCGALVD